MVEIHGFSNRDEATVFTNDREPFSFEDHLHKAEWFLDLPENSLRTPNKETYINNIFYGWLDRVLYFGGPETDDRLGVEEGVSLIREKVHRPDDLDDVVLSGESCSWNFLMSDFLKKIWIKIRVNLKEVIEKSTDQETFEKELNGIKEYVANLFYFHLEKYINFAGVPVEHIFVAGSGAQAIMLAKRMIRPGDENLFATTLETGSEIYGLLPQKEVAIALRFDKIENGKKETNIPYSQREVAAEYITLIENGYTMITFTACSKTGLRYDIPDENGECALDIVLDFVSHYNKTAQPTVEIIIDAVQLAGKVPLHQIVRFMNMSNVCGVVHSSSKYPGGSPHSGKLLLNDRGLAEYKKNRELTEEDAKEYQIVFAGGVEPAEMDVLAQIRAVDNFNAIVDAEEVVSHPEYPATIEKVRSMYIEVFNYLGFTILHNHTPEIIALEAPTMENVQPRHLNELFLSFLAQNGVSCGGFLQHGTEPILRFGISIRVMRQLIITGEMDYNTLSNSLVKLKKVLQDALNATLEAVAPEAEEE